MHVAVAGVHVQGDEHPALEHALVQRVALGQHRLVFPAGEDLAQFGAHLPLPGHAQAVVLEGAEHALALALGGMVGDRTQAGRQGRVQVIQIAFPAAAHLGQQA